MATDLPHGDLRSLCEFLESLERSGAADLTAEQAIDLWRAQNPTKEPRRDDVLAVQEAISDMKAGDTGTPLDEFVDDFRQQHDIAPDV